MKADVISAAMVFEVRRGVAPARAVPHGPADADAVLFVPHMVWIRPELRHDWAEKKDPRK